MESISIKSRIIGSKQPCFIIAEAGSNHDGDFNKAVRLIEIAKQSGADAVKFQLFKADKIAAEYISEETRITDKFARFGNSVIDLYRKFEMPREWVPKLIKACQEQDIIFLITPFDLDAVDFLEDQGVLAYKIASFELTHLPLIQKVAKTKKPIMLSTGMGNLEEIEDAVAAVKKEGNTQIAILHCAIGYPLEPADVNLRNIVTLKENFNFPVGYSDHTDHISIPIAAVALGADIIEKHFALEGSRSPDSDFALKPEGLKDMIRGIRQVESALGSYSKGPQPSELKHLKRGRRSIFAKVELVPGEIISAQKIDILRPGTGISPKYYDLLLGKRVLRRVAANNPLQWEDFIS